MTDMIIVEEREYACTLVINRPDRRNALNRAVLLGMGDALNRLRGWERPPVVILRGAGRDAFCAGVDLASVTVTDEAEMRRFIEGLAYCLQSLIDYPSPVIALIYGHAVGAGLDLAVIADFRLAAGNALMGANLVKLGRIYYYTAAFRLANLVGWGAAKELLLIGGLVNADRAREMGLVNRVLPAEQLEEEGFALARELTEENSFQAVTGTKSMIRKLMDSQVLNPGVETDLKAIMESVNSGRDAREGPRSFLEKRRPVFRDDS
jgi:enoyl-CoA hydratase/carnithine racemase